MAHGAGTLITPASLPKQVAGISNGTTPLPTGSTGFSPPSPLPVLQFTLGQLAGSMARAIALRNTSRQLIAALTIGAQELLAALVDPFGLDLAFVRDVEDLADNARTTFSGSLGGGITDLYMTSLGYSFRCNGRELVKLPAKAFDLAYAGGPAGSAIVAAEAKGQVRAGVTLASVMRVATDGYQLQVEQFVGKPLGSSSVLHGYGIGIGAQPRSGTHCLMHVEETGLSVPTGGSVRIVTSQQGGGGSKPSGVQGTRYEQVDCRVALGNFRDAFRLMGGGGIMDAIDAALAERWRAAQRMPTYRLPVVQWRGEEYVVPIQVDDGRSTRAKAFAASFGLRRDAAERFFAGMTQLIQRQKLPQSFPMELIVHPTDLQLEIDAGDGGAEFPDGLAYFGSAPPRPTPGMMWDPRALAYAEHAFSVP